MLIYIITAFVVGTIGGAIGTAILGAAVKARFLAAEARLKLLEGRTVVTVEADVAKVRALIADELNKISRKTIAKRGK